MNQQSIVNLVHVDNVRALSFFIYTLLIFLKKIINKLIILNKICYNQCINTIIVVMMIL